MSIYGKLTRVYIYTGFHTSVLFAVHTFEHIIHTNIITKIVAFSPDVFADHFSRSKVRHCLWVYHSGEHSSRCLSFSRLPRTGVSRNTCLRCTILQKQLTLQIIYSTYIGWATTCHCCLCSTWVCIIMIQCMSLWAFTHAQWPQFRVPFHLCTKSTLKGFIR